MRFLFIITVILLSCENISDNEYQLPESYFEHNISNKVAFYFFNTILINGYSPDTNDWIGAFNGDICVGSRHWENCNNSTCEIPVYGENSINELTEGYMLPNGIPSFKIYDESEGLYYDAIASSQIPWQDGIFPVIDSLIVE